MKLDLNFCTLIIKRVLKGKIKKWQGKNSNRGDPRAMKEGSTGEMHWVPGGACRAQPGPVESLSSHLCEGFQGLLTVGYLWSIRDEDTAKSRCSPLYSGQTSKPHSYNKVGSVFQDLQSDFKLESLCSTALERLEELSKSLEIPSCHFWDVETECLEDTVQCCVKFLRFVAEEDV